MSESETGEWTTVTVNSFISGLASQTKNPHQVIADAHNAALAAERAKYQGIVGIATDLQNKLAAERGYCEHLRENVKTLAKQLAAEGEAREAQGRACERLKADFRKQTNKLLTTAEKLQKDNEQLREQLAPAEREKVQPLVDALTKTRDLIDSYNSTDKPAVDFLSDIEIIVYDALEKVKEGKVKV